MGVILVVHLVGYKNHSLNALVTAAVLSNLLRKIGCLSENPNCVIILPNFGQLVLLNQTADYCKVGVFLVVHLVGYKNHPLNALVTAVFFE